MKTCRNIGIISSAFAFITAAIVTIYSISEIIIIATIICIIGSIFGLVGSFLIEKNGELSRTFLVIATITSFLTINIISGILYILVIVLLKKEGIMIINKKVLFTIIIMLILALITTAFIFFVNQNTNSTLIEEATQKILTVDKDFDGTVYWTEQGDTYHIFFDCPSMNNGDSLTEGSLERAFKNNKKVLCPYCIGDK